MSSVPAAPPSTGRFAGPLVLVALVALAVGLAAGQATSPDRTVTPASCVRALDIANETSGFASSTLQAITNALLGGDGSAAVNCRAGR
jgi:hypothetical protein